MKIEFSFDTPYGKFSDALYFDGSLPSEAEIETLKQERLTNWLLVVSAPPVGV